MKTLITAIVLAVTATSASAYTCKNTVEMINGEWSYTTSQCGNQAPASAEVLEMITYTANNPPKDNVEEEAVVEVVVVEEVIKLSKMAKQKAKLADLIRQVNPTASDAKIKKIVKVINQATRATANNNFAKADRLANKATILATEGLIVDNITKKVQRQASRSINKMVKIHTKRLNRNKKSITVSGY